MDKSTAVRTGLAAAVAGLGLAVGGVALASAEDGTERPGRGGGFFAEQLADALGIDQDEVETALGKVHDDLAPERPDLSSGERPAPPTEEELAEHQAAFAQALAEALGISEDRVTDALESLRAEAEERGEEFRAELRDRLVERLDAAVEDGTLTEADKASVLKAYDAGVIGGPFGWHGFGGGPMGGGRGLMGGLMGGPMGGPMGGQTDDSAALPST